MASTKTPYEILGVNSSASPVDIRNAYRNLAKKYHPDLNPGNKDAEKHFKEINSANELIGTPEARLRFDQGEFDAQQHQASHAASGDRQGPFYHQTQQAGGRYSSSFEGMDDDILQSIFGKMGGRMGGRTGYSGRSSADMRGEDAFYQMDIDFNDAVLGAEREIILPGEKRLIIKIPAGVESGAKLRFSGMGGSGHGKAPSGDAYVQLNVRPSRLFKREEYDLEVELPVSISEAVLGAEVRVPTIDGSILLKIPSQVSSGQRIRIPGKGVPTGQAGQRGDQFVVIKVVTPQVVDADFKQAVEAWCQRQPFDPRANWDGVKGGAT